jgi:bifunctional DNA-binding transcriptional regulator/antitoxin component of YhaV-PrlF toxin-antitoxin module
MVITDEGKVGKRGEILPKQPLREIAGLAPGDRILIEARPGEIIIKKILSIDEIFDLEPIAEYDPDEIEEILDDLSEKQAIKVD